ncbi:MAG: hypothetical protein HY208_05720 [Nitrospirae bacterium]|nr:hypothetical protein [Nitrospirota bacterium]
MCNRHRQRVIRGVLLGTLLGGFLCGVLIGTAPAAAPHPVDNLLLAKILWGMPAERVAQALKLERGQYTILHDPVDGQVTIFQLEGKQLNYPEFRVVFLNFKPEEGLFKVYGFYQGTLTEAAEALKKRYGDPDAVKKTSTMQSFRWEFADTALSLINAQFEISLK